MKMKKSLLGLTILLSAGLTVHVEAADQKAVVAQQGISNLFLIKILKVN